MIYMTVCVCVCLSGVHAAQQSSEHQQQIRGRLLQTAVRASHEPEAREMGARAVGGSEWSPTTAAGGPWQPMRSSAQLGPRRGPGGERGWMDGVW